MGAKGAQRPKSICELTPGCALACTQAAAASWDSDQQRQLFAGEPGAPPGGASCAPVLPPVAALQASALLMAGQGADFRPACCWRRS